MGTRGSRFRRNRLALLGPRPGHRAGAEARRWLRGWRPYDPGRQRPDREARTTRRPNTFLGAERVSAATILSRVIYGSRVALLVGVLVRHHRSGRRSSSSGMIAGFSGGLGLIP